MKASGDYSSIGTYWEKGNQNEIDIVAINEDKKTMLIAEVKRNPEKINMALLEERSQKLLQKHKKYAVSFKGYSLENLGKDDWY